jgi:transmembrane sensor
MREQPEDAEAEVDGLQTISDSPRPDIDAAGGDRLQQEAIAWLSLLSSGTATLADGEALKRWCREDPAHAEAYAKAARVWGMLTPIATQAPRAQIEALAMAASTQPTIGRRAFLGGAIAASLAGSAYAAVQPPLGLWPSLAELGADVRTATGEQRRINVTDGVAVDLNTRSSLAYGNAVGHTRQVELINGEAMIAAGLPVEQSCVVVAGAGRIIANDARFDVRHHADGQVRVVCLEGQVRVEHQAETIALTARREVVYDRRGIGATEAIDPMPVAAWQQGRLVFRKAPLWQVVDEVNRYRPGRIVLMSNNLGTRLIDASFQLDRLDNMIIYLQQAFDARVRRLPGAVVLIS